MTLAPAEPPAHRVVHRETVPGGRYWSMVIRRGHQLRLTDLAGRANAALLLYNPHDPGERYNMADTLKGQHTYRLTRGNMLYSDMGRVMMSIVEDSLGWHDAIGGSESTAELRLRHGEARYQEHRNDFQRGGRELFLIELTKLGLELRDLVACVNLFSKVVVDSDGTMAFVPGHSRAGAEVVLRAEMDTLAVLSTAAHPLDPAERYQPGEVALHIERAAPVEPDDYCIGYRPENARAWANTAIYHCQLEAGEAKR